MFVCLLDDLIPGFCYSSSARETGGLKFPSTITLVLQANPTKKIKCASHSLLQGGEANNAPHILEQPRKYHNEKGQKTSEVYKAS